MTVFFATFLTGIPEIPRVGAFFAAFRAADDRAFRAETGNQGFTMAYLSVTIKTGLDGEIFFSVTQPLRMRRGIRNTSQGRNS